MLNYREFYQKNFTTQYSTKIKKIHVFLPMDHSTTKVVRSIKRNRLREFNDLGLQEPPIPAGPWMWNKIPNVWRVHTLSLTGRVRQPMKSLNIIESPLVGFFICFFIQLSKKLVAVTSNSAFEMFFIDGCIYMTFVE